MAAKRKPARKNVSLGDKREAHPTNKGPGRIHAAIAHGKLPTPTKGGAFLGQHKNPGRNAERALAKAQGHRQIKRARMAPLRALRDVARPA